MALWKKNVYFTFMKAKIKELFGLSLKEIYGALPLFDELFLMYSDACKCLLYFYNIQKIKRLTRTTSIFLLSGIEDLNFRPFHLLESFFIFFSKIFALAEFY
jgi:hypothetical protein